VTLACLAADATGATPTAAADLVVPDRADIDEDLVAVGRRLAGATRRVADRARRELALVASRPGLTRPHEAVVRRPRDRTRALGVRLRREVRDAAVAPARDLAGIAARRRRVGEVLPASATARLHVLGARLRGRDPERPLAEGFALVRDLTGRAVTSAAATRSAGDVTLIFADGMVPARVQADEEDA